MGARVTAGASCEGAMPLFLSAPAIVPGFLFGGRGSAGLATLASLAGGHPQICKMHSKGKGALPRARAREKQGKNVSITDLYILL